MKTDILIVGAGPAGLAAAASAASCGAKVDVIDDNFSSGGQIWRGGAGNHKDQRASALWQSLSERKNVRFHFQTRVLYANSANPANSANAAHQLLTESAGASHTFECSQLILATGARELLLPFPGWTLPGVTGAGGLQALAKNGFPVQGKRVVVAGSGPLLLAVAASLSERGAIVTHILEQASLPQLGRFALSLCATPSKIWQGLQLRKSLGSTSYCSNSYVLAARNEGQAHGHLNSVQVSLNGKTQVLDCDYLACGFGLLPNSELAAGIGCELDLTQGFARVRVDQWQASSVTQVYCAGESTGVGGVDLALAEGAIAGFSAGGNQERARRYFHQRQHWLNFSQRLASGFKLRPELRQLAQANTLVCRCEDVSYGKLQAHDNWRSAKLHTRCGMGACQGRICGAASQFLFNWNKDAGRLPFAPSRIDSLCKLGTNPDNGVTSEATDN